MTRSSVEQRITDEDREEYMGVGGMIIKDIQELINTTSSKIQTQFTHDVILEIGGTETEPTRSVEILLSFVITDLGGSNETQIKTFIHQRLVGFFKEQSMKKYTTQWSFKAPTTATEN